RGLWLSVVPRRRAGLSASAQRHRPTGKLTDARSSPSEPPRCNHLPLRPITSSSSSRFQPEEPHATRTLVADRRHLSDLSAVVSGQQRRRHWELARNDAQFVFSV